MRISRRTSEENFSVKDCSTSVPERDYNNSGERLRISVYYRNFTVNDRLCSLALS